MPVVERYIFKDAAFMFLAALLVLTGTIWVTQALREVDLLTNKGQTVLIFLELTLLTIPSLVMILAPVALLIATIYSLNRLNGDSELVVMSSAGMSPARLLRPYAWLAAVVMVLIAVISLWIMPASFRNIRDLVSKIRTDVLTRIVREGQFITLDKGFIFHYRERGSDGALRGLFIQDRREPDKINTYVAEIGRTVEADGHNYLVLEKGSLQRQARGDRDPAIVQFERYAIDLAQFTQKANATYKPRERYTSELLRLKPDTAYTRANFGKFRAELHDRFAGPLYALVFVFIAFAALGQPRTTRQGRGMAIVAAVVVASAVRGAGFGISAYAAKNSWAFPLVYLLPLVAVGLAVLSALRPGWTQGVRGHLPNFGRKRAAAA
ncbi:MAG: LPS export ABC transporter permease LptF [Hyphomicrobiales bacterium]|nr:LPS export ABC transporter permease LptF [Hyphomicrobiales bacterium]